MDQNKGKITMSKRADLSTKVCNSKVFEVQYGFICYIGGGEYDTLYLDLHDIILMVEQN